MRGSGAEVLGAIWGRTEDQKRGPVTRRGTAMSDERKRERSRGIRAEVPVM